MSVSLAGKALLLVLAGLAATIGWTADAAARNPVLTIEVRVWQDVNDERDIRISARPEDGSWRTLGTIRLPLDDGASSSGRFRYGNLDVAVPLEDGVSTDVAIRIWQNVQDERDIRISARPEGGSWRTLGTLPLPLDDGTSSSGRFRYGNARLGVLAPRGQPSWAQLPVPPLTLEYRGDFSPEERARAEHLLRPEYERVVRFFATRHGLTVPDLTIRLTRPDSEWDRGFAYGQGVIHLSVATDPPNAANSNAVAGPGGSITIGVDELGFLRHFGHEYVHALQDEIADTIGGPLWIREGMAWYLEYLFEYAASPHQRHKQFLANGQHAFEKARQSLWWGARLSHEMPLEDMEFGSWSAGVGFLAMERLVERSGEASLFDFYRRFATVNQEDDSWKDAFADTFGLTVDEFYEDFAAWRAEAAPPEAYFTGVVLGPDGTPVTGSAASPLDPTAFWSALHVGPLRSVPGDMSSWGPEPSWVSHSGIVREDGTFRTLAYPSALTVLEVTNPIACGAIAFVAEDGSLTRNPDAARRFTIELEGVSGIEIRLPAEPDALCTPAEAHTWAALWATGWEEPYEFHYE
ncbi:MAG: hypothetical protein OXE43_14390 [Chloroflexi bacterium]|nr:hypothetical protein [Chloroflexota bacterium]